MLTTNDSINAIRKEAKRQGYKLHKKRGEDAFIVADMFTNCVVTYGSYGSAWCTLEDVVNFLNE